MRWFGALVTAFVLVACGADQPLADPQQPPDAPVSAPPADPGGDDAGTPQAVTPRPGMADVRPIAWERATVDDDDRTVSVVWWSGVEPCNVLDHVAVGYTETDVTITLFEGHDPAQPNAACIEIAQQKVTDIVLDEPLAGRDLIDGAPRPPASP